MPYTQDNVNNQSFWGGKRPSYDEELKKSRMGNGLFDRPDIRDTDSFIKFNYLDPYNRVGNTFEYVFFTKPDLYVNGVGTPIFNYALQNGSRAIRDLTLSSPGNSLPFSAILYNHRASNLDLPDLDSQDMETAENMWGQKIYYRKSSSASNDDFDFSLEFTDNKYHDVYDFFKLYDEYEIKKFYGGINLGQSPNHKKYILERKLHDQMSVYKFIVGEDGREILYWAKLYGVYPKNVPRSAFSDMPADGNMKFTVNFKANMIEDMDPMVIEDFRRLSNQYPGSSTRLYDDSLGYVNNTFGPPPTITTEVDKYRNRTRYIFQWRD